MTRSTATLLDIGRRPFLTGAAALAAAASVPGIARARGSAAYDVIMIGGGTTGLPLAILAADRGARVLLIDRAPVIGGTLDRSQASTSAGGSLYQKQSNIADSAAEHFDDVMRSSQNLADPALVKLWTDNAADTVAWLVANGVKFDYKPRMPERADAIYRKPRMQMAVGGGAAVISALQPRFDKAAAAGKISAQMSTRVVELIQDRHGAVTGVVAQDEKGVLTAFTGRNVVIASGGCHGNATLFNALHKVPLYWAAGFPFNAGDGLMLGQSVGGYLRGADSYIPIFGIVMNDEFIPSTPAEGSFMDTTLSEDTAKHPPWSIWVNADGQRFTAEDSTTPQKREIALGRQPGHRLWSVYDQAGFDQPASPMQGWSREQYVAEFDKNPMFYKAATVEQLGLLAGISPTALQASVAEYNAALKNRNPDKFGRVIRPAPIEKPPFYAVRYQGFHLLTFAGLAVDGTLRVIRPDGTPIPNLYAAGEVLGATALGGGGHASGSMVTSAIGFGKILAERILKI